ncbi:hypothetical protein A8144_07820 [Mycobacterium leprae 3125609]|nr:hypothetical protein A8144_07820 [Mycobacterium leprae 3125609]OAX71235.1 hypothetical protein A3216_07085 [Mycobacterium leprae 7935681]
MIKANIKTQSTYYWCDSIIIILTTLAQLNRDHYQRDAGGGVSDTTTSIPLHVDHTRDQIPPYDR